MRSPFAAALKRLSFVPWLAALASVAVGCASARMSERDADRLFREGRYEESAKSLEKGLKEQGTDGRDLLLYLLDMGLALHTAGQYAESNRYFLKADKIAEIKDYTSLATEGATLLTTDAIKDYKGEDFEKVLINTYLAMNFALLGETESALVEARRVNRKLYLMVTEGQRKYKQNAFARYLSAILYESQGDWNDAYIDYKKAYELEPGFPHLGQDLWRMSSALGMSDEREKWEEQFGLGEEDKKAAKSLLSRKSGMGEIVVIYQNGISPIKKPNPDFSQIPKFYPRPNPVVAAAVEVDGKVVANTARLHDIEATAIENLDEKYAGLIAKKLAGVVAKEVVAHQVEKQTNSPLLGFLTRVAFYASDQADCRSWNLLPKDLQLVRIPLAAGTYKVRVLPSGAAASPERVVELKAGKKVFVNFRYTP